jgi:replicative DNA helicase
MSRSPDYYPHNLEAERALLGCVLLDNSAMGTVLETLGKDDFFSRSHREIYDTMLTLATANQVIDAVTLSENLRVYGLLEQVGGPLYLSMLTDSVPLMAGAAPVGDYAKIVKDSSALRRLISTCDELRARAMTGQENLQTLLDSAQDAILNLGAGRDARDHVATFREAAVSLVRSLERKDLRKIETGIPKLDRLTGGFLPGELVVFTAETGSGKTFLAQQVRRHNCRRGQHTLFASTEMMREHLLARELPVDACVPMWKMRWPEQILPEEMNCLVDTLPRQCDVCQILDGEITMPRVAAAAKPMHRAGNLHLVVVDYDELVTAPGKDDNERQASVATACKALAVHLSVPVVLVSQLRKLLSGEDRAKPSLDRLYGAGAKRKHASIVIFARREYVESLDDEDLTDADLWVLKNRNGRMGRIPAHFELDTLTFRGAEEVDEGIAS